MNKEIKLEKRICTRCEHEWILRKPQRPKVCPRCKSAYWDVPKQTVYSTKEPGALAKISAIIEDLTA